MLVGVSEVHGDGEGLMTLGFSDASRRSTSESFRVGNFSIGPMGEFSVEPWCRELLVVVQLQQVCQRISEINPGQVLRCRLSSLARPWPTLAPRRRVWSANTDAGNSGTALKTTVVPGKRNAHVLGRFGIFESHSSLTSLCLDAAVLQQFCLDVRGRM